MPNKKNWVGILGKKQGGHCIRVLFSQMIQTIAERHNGIK